MRVEAVGGAVLDLDAGQGDVGLRASGSVFLDAADEARLMARVVGAIAVDGQVGDRDVFNGFQSRSNDAVDPGIEVVGEPDGGLSHAIADESDARQQFDRTYGRIGGIARDRVGSGAELNLHLLSGILQVSLVSGLDRRLNR